MKAVASLSKVLLIAAIVVIKLMIKFMTTNFFLQIPRVEEDSNIVKT